jgi:large subunit ribosomal protein L15
LSQLDAAFNAGDVADETTMREKKLLAKGECVIKVLANGDISKAITVKAAKFSEAAKAKIEAAGGSVEIIG